MIIHVVRSGESIYSIANSYGVRASDIIINNGINNPDRIIPGQSLVILIPQIEYIIKPGDTLNSIAEQFNITPLNILQNNPQIIGMPYIIAGNRLVIKYNDEKRRNIRLNGFAYPNINRGILQKALTYLTYLTIFAYGFDSEGNLTTINDQPLINLSYLYKVAPVMMIATISPDGGFNGDNASIIFNDTALQDKLINNILNVMLEKGYLGVDVDFEYLNPEDKDKYVAFLKRLTEKMHENNFFVMADLAPKTSANQQGFIYEGHDYKGIAESVDDVMVMTYEWGYTYGPPMAVAPLNKVRDVIEYALTEMSADKLMMGMPNYGYDWKLPFVSGESVARAIGNEAAVNIAINNNVNIQFDNTAMSPYFNYTADGIKHEVWFEDARSVNAKYELIIEKNLQGAGYWNLMTPFAQNYAVVNSLFNITKIV